MTPDHAFRDEVISQLEGDILSFGWLRQMAELEFGHAAGGDSRRAVFDLACTLADSGIAVVGDAKSDGKIVLISAWCQRGEALKEKMAGKVDGAPPEDRDWAFWLQLSVHHMKPSQALQPTPTSRGG